MPPLLPVAGWCGPHTHLAFTLGDIVPADNKRGPARSPRPSGGTTTVVNFASNGLASICGPRSDDGLAAAEGKAVID